MLSLGMRLPRKSRDKTRTRHACVGMFCVIGFCEVCLHAWLCITCIVRCYVIEII